MAESKPKRAGISAITIGWILNAISCLVLCGIWMSPSRDPSVIALVRSPSLNAIAGSCGVLLGANIATIPPLILGLYEYFRDKNPRGRPLFICSIVIFAGITFAHFLPHPDFLPPR